MGAIQGLDKFKFDVAPTGESILTPNDTVLVGNYNSVSSGGTTPIKVKTIKMLLNGSIRVKHNLRSLNTISYSKLYKNGVEIPGTTDTVSSTSYTIFAHDISVKKNDLIELYLYSYDSVTTASNDSFTICGTIVGGYGEVI